MIKNPKTPWKRHCFQIYDAFGDRVAHTGHGQLPAHRSAEAEENAELIVQAVNKFSDDDASYRDGDCYLADCRITIGDLRRAVLTDDKGQTP